MQPMHLRSGRTCLRDSPGPVTSRSPQVADVVRLELRRLRVEQHLLNVEVLTLAKGFHERVGLLIGHLLAVHVEELHENRVLSLLEEVEVTVSLEDLRDLACLLAFVVAWGELDEDCGGELLALVLLDDVLHVLGRVKVEAAPVAIKVHHHAVHLVLGEGSFLPVDGLVAQVVGVDTSGSVLFGLVFGIFDFLMFEHMHEGYASHMGIVGGLVIVRKKSLSVVVAASVREVKLAAQVVFEFLVSCDLLVHGSEASVVESLRSVGQGFRVESVRETGVPLLGELEIGVWQFAYELVVHVD
jgi:hypothetical protein